MKEQNLIVLGILVVLTAVAAGFILLKNNAPRVETATQTVEEPQGQVFCKEFIGEQVSCISAVSLAHRLYKGEVVHVDMSYLPGEGDIKEDVAWLIALNLQDPVQTEDFVAKAMLIEVSKTTGEVARKIPLSAIIQ